MPPLPVLVSSSPGEKLLPDFDLCKAFYCRYASIFPSTILESSSYACHALDISHSTFRREKRTPNKKISSRIAFKSNDSPLVLFIAEF